MDMKLNLDSVTGIYQDVSRQSLYFFFNGFMGAGWGENGMHVVISSWRLLSMSLHLPPVEVPEGPGPPPVACSA